MVPRPFIKLPLGASPFAFPMESNEACAVLKKLRRHGVEGLHLWNNAHPSLPAKKFPLSTAFRNRFFAVPVHQELTQSELFQISEAIHRSTIPKHLISTDNDSYGSNQETNHSTHRPW
jgi:hypothetical protein